MKRHGVGHKGKARRQGFRRRLRSFPWFFMLLIFIVASITPSLFAEDRLADGVKDIAKGTAAIPQEVAETANNSNIINGILVGTAKGAISTLENIAKGVLKILTFYAKNE